MKSPCLEVPPSEGESVRRRLQEAGVLRKDLRIEREKDRLFIPVTERVDLGRPVLEREFKQAFTAVRSYRDVVQVPPRLAPLLPKAFDVIGDIVVLRIPEELKGYEGAIGDAILKWNTKLRTVAVDEGVGGELRIRKVRVVAGEPRTRTEHIEFGLRYLVDVERAYFSPRLGAERQRVAAQVSPGETVVDMFAGVGPYAILIARTRHPKTVHAIDANPAAVELLRENVRRNRADVAVHEGLGQEILPRLAPVDRVIMDLPQGAREFLPATVPCVRYGGIVHFYAIAERGRVAEAREDALVLVRHGRRSAQVLGTRVVRGYSPGRVHLAMDLRII
jgi:tRNA (guanine37-N1)-methyltransferase